MPRPRTGTTTQINKLIADQWEAWMRWDPLFATSCGDHRFNDRLPEAGEEHYVSWHAQLVSFQRHLQKFERSTLPLDVLEARVRE